MNWIKDSLFNKMVLEKLEIHMQKCEIGPILIPHTKINSEWIKYLNIRPETIKFLEKNVEKNILDTILGNYFLDISSTV